MGLFDWLRKKAEPAPPSAGSAPAVPAGKRRFSTDRTDLFDLERTHALHGLFRVPKEARDEAWHALFFDAAWHGSTEQPSPQPFTGPDGFAYLRFDVPRGGAFDSQSLGNLAPSLVEGGVGAAVFASPDDPPETAQFVFSMGRLVSMLRFDSADGDPADLHELERSTDGSVYEVQDDGTHQRLTVKADHEVLVGSPSRDYLPPAVARALYRHLTEGWKIADPRVAVMVDPAASPTRSLVIGRKRDGFGPDQNPDEAARMLLWYLTPRQSLMLLPDSMELNEMARLADYLD